MRAKDWNAWIRTAPQIGCQRRHARLWVVDVPRSMENQALPAIRPGRSGFAMTSLGLPGGSESGRMRSCVRDCTPQRAAPPGHNFAELQGRRFHLHASGANSRQNGWNLGVGEHPGKCAAELPELMGVAGANDGLAVPFGNAARPPVEIEAGREEPARLDRIEQFKVLIQLPPKAAASRIIRVRRNNQRVRPLMSGDLGKSVQVIAACPEVIDQHMLAVASHHLHRRYQGDAVRGGKFIEARVPDIQVMAGDCQDLVFQPCGFPNQVFGRIGTDPVVDRIKVAMGMQFRFQPTHGLLIGRIAAVRPEIRISASGCRPRVSRHAECLATTGGAHDTGGAPSSKTILYLRIKPNALRAGSREQKAAVSRSGEDFGCDGRKSRTPVHSKPEFVNKDPAAIRYDPLRATANRSGDSRTGSRSRSHKSPLDPHPFRGVQ